MVKRLNKKQVLILKAIARYKFITYSQIVTLGIEKHKNKLSSLFSDMRDCKRPLIKKIPHRFGVEAKHYLTKKGKEVLLELYEDMSEENIRLPIGAIHTDTQDQKHRTTTIDLQIKLDFACQKHNIPLLLCDRYFDCVGDNRINKNLKSKTAILYNDHKSLKADLTFIFQTSTQKELYLLELENGKDTKKAVQKCINHGKALFRRSANEKYKFTHGYRTLWVFEHQSIMQATMGRLKENPFFKHLVEFFLFKALDNMEGDFFEDWRNLSGDNRRMYYIL